MSLRVIDWETFSDPSRSSGQPAWEDKPLALSIGVFDGVHRGHQRLIARILKHAGEYGGLGGVITFRQNPRRVLHPKSYPGDIYGLPRKLRILEELGVGFAVLIDFSGDFSRITGEEFTVLLRKRRISYLAVGANFRCGYHLDTSARQIREMMSEGGTRTELVSQLRMGGVPVSSSRIRQAVLSGDIADASELLGRPYSLDLSGLCPRLEGSVFSWEAEGRVLPPAGLYSVFIRSGAAVFPAEISLDSGRLVLERNWGAGGFAGSEVPPATGDFLNNGLLSIEFRP